MNEQTNEAANEEAANFQKIWMETMSKTMQAAFTFTPGAPAPEVLRQIRSGIFQALADSWEKFMRSPEFLESMKQWMEQAVTFRKTTNDFLGKVRHEAQAPSCDDVDTIMLAVRHMEKRLLDRIEQLSAQVNGSKPARTKGPTRSMKQPLSAKRKARTTTKSPPP
jgi:hypothetical protein